MMGGFPFSKCCRLLSLTVECAASSSIFSTNTLSASRANSQSKARQDWSIEKLEE
jgi:hypothetical protein